MNLREAAQQALVDMACVRDMVAHPDNLQFIDKAITALRAALEQPEQEPVTGVVLNEEGRAALVEHGTEQWHVDQRRAQRLYTHPPRREWQGLTEDEVFKCLPPEEDEMAFARAIEAALKEKNHE